MAIQSEVFSTSYGVRSFSSTKHIATKQHLAIWLKRTSDNIWVQLSTTKYELINNSAVLTEAPSSSIYSEIEIRVADEPDELSQSQSDIGVVASNITSINLVADNIGLITQQANGEYIVSSLPSSASIGDVAVNVADGNIYKYEESGWVYIGESGTSSDSIITVPTLPTTGVAEGTVMLNTTDNQFYKYTNGAWVVVTLTTGVAQEVADASITTAKFASGIVPVELFDALPSSGNFNGRIGFLKTDFKLYRHNGTAWVSTVPTTDLAGTITATQITDGSITTPKLSVGSVTSDIIGANAITAGKIATNAVTAGTIAVGAVNADQIAAGAIRSDKIYSNAIQTYHMAAGSINADRIQAGTLTADKIVSNSLTDFYSTGLVLYDFEGEVTSTSTLLPYQKIFYLSTVTFYNIVSGDIDHLVKLTASVIINGVNQFEVYLYSRYPTQVPWHYVYHNNTSSSVSFGVKFKWEKNSGNGTWISTNPVKMALQASAGYYAK